MKSDQQTARVLEQHLAFPCHTHFDPVPYCAGEMSHLILLTGCFVEMVVVV